MLSHPQQDMKHQKQSALFLTTLILVISSMGPKNAFALFDRGGILGEGARAMGLSGAFVSIADDPSAAYWNPAGLAQLDQPELLGMYGSYSNDTDRDVYLSFHYPLPKDIHLAVSADALFYTDIAGAYEEQYEGSVAIPLDFVTQKRLLFGANFRYLLSDPGSGSGLVRGIGVDLGFLYRQPFKDNSAFKAGLVLTDVSTTLTYDSTGVEQSIPSILTAGLAYQFDPFTFVTTDIPWTLSNDTLLGGDDVRIRGGVEHWFFDGKFGLRAGCISFLTLPAEFSVGASYRTADWSIDYAFSSHPDLGNNHRLSASYFFGFGDQSHLQPRPTMVLSYVGDQKIYLKWDTPKGSQTDGYLVYIRNDDEKDFHRAKQELLQTQYCLLRGAKNGVRYHIIIRSVVGGQEKYSCAEWVAIPQAMSADAKVFYDQGMQYFNQDKLSAALYSARKAEELDPNNYDIKDLIRKLETTHHEGLVPEESQSGL